MADLKILSTRENVNCKITNAQIFQVQQEGAFPRGFGLWLSISPEKKDLSGVELIKNGVINSDFLNQTNFERIEYKNFFVAHEIDEATGEPKTNWKENAVYKALKEAWFVAKDGKPVFNEKTTANKMAVNISEIECEPFIRSYTRDVFDKDGKKIASNGDRVTDSKGNIRVFTSFVMLTTNGEDPLRMAQRRWQQNRDVRVDDPTLPPVWETVKDWQEKQALRSENPIIEGDNNGSNNGNDDIDF